MLHELTEGEAGLLVMLFPRLAGLDLEHAEDLGEMVRITARTRTASLACRGCGVVSSQVHDRVLARPGRPGLRRAAGAGGAGGPPVLLRQHGLRGGDVR